MDEFRAWIPGFALAASLWALWWSWRGWRESNRPIVVVYLESLDGELGAIAFNLVVRNCGNRPALDVRLRTDMRALLECVDARAVEQPIQQKLISDIKRCFTSDASIPVLLPSATASNSFGYSGTPRDGPFLKYRSSFYVVVLYCDVEQHEYEHRILVRVQDTIGFAGGTWHRPGA